VTPLGACFQFQFLLYLLVVNAKKDGKGEMFVLTSLPQSPSFQLPAIATAIRTAARVIATARTIAGIVPGATVPAAARTGIRT
jgi:hypothetical protein